MTLTPLLTAGGVIPLHGLLGLLAIAVGALQMLLPKGGRRHRIMGWGLVLALAGVAISGLFIHEIRLVGPWSPIHLIIPYTLFSLYAGVRAARQGNISRHKTFMTSLAVMAIFVTGALTLLPGRVMHQVLFG